MSDNTQVSEKEEVKEPVVAPVEVPVHEKEVIQDVVRAATITGIVGKLHDLLLECSNMIGLYKQKHAVLADQEEAVAAKKKDLESLNNSLFEREATVRRVEDIINMHGQALAMQDRYTRGLNDLEDAKTFHKREVGLFKDQQTEERESTRREAEAVLKQRKNIDQEVAKRVQTTLVSMGLVKPLDESLHQPIAQPIEQSIESHPTVADAVTS